MASELKETEGMIVRVLQTNFIKCTLKYGEMSAADVEISQQEELLPLLLGLKRTGKVHSTLQLYRDSIFKSIKDKIKQVHSIIKTLLSLLSIRL